MNNRIELLLQAVLSKDSTTTIKNQVKELQQQLDSLKLDSKLVEQLKEVENLKINVDSKEFTKLSKELQQSQDAVDKLKEKSKELNEVAKQVSFKIDDKTFLRDFDALKKHVEERGGKLDFTIETDGARKEITKLSATFDEFGKKTTEVFKKAEVNGAIVWDVSKINHHDSKVRDTTRAYEELSNALTKMGRDGKITHEQMQRLTKELESSKGSHEAIAKINDELVKLSQSNANIEKLNKSLKSLYDQGNITKHQFEQLNETINKGTIDGKQYKYLEQQMNELSRAHKQRVKDIVDEIKETERLKNANVELQDVMAKLIRNAQHKPKMTQDENYSKTINELNQLDNLLKKGQISSAEFSARLKQVNSDLNVMSAKATETGRTQIGIIDSFKIAMEKFPVWMAATTLFYGTIRTAREFMSVIVDIDTKMTDLRKVMADGTDFDAVFDRATESAEKFGRTISETMDAYIEFAKQGFVDEELGYLADAATVLGNVGDMSSLEAAEGLTATMVQWRKEASEAMDVADKWNELANRFPTQVNQLSEGLSRSSSVAKAVGLTFEETTAIIGTLTASMKQSGAEIG